MQIMCCAVLNEQQAAAEIAAAERAEVSTTAQLLHCIRYLLQLLCDAVHMYHVERCTLIKLAVAAQSAATLRQVLHTCSSCLLQ
jgi:hypothetical protein